MKPTLLDRGIPSSRILLGSFLGCLLSMAAGAQPVAEIFELRPGVLVDRGAGNAFVMAPGGGVDCVRLGDGALLWRSRLAHKPLALHGPRLLAQVDSSTPARLDLAILSAANGDPLETLTADLPAEVFGWIDDRLGGTFRARGRSGADGVLLAWTSSRQVVQGMPTDLAAAQPRVREGAFAVDLSAATVAAVAPPPRLLEERRPLLEAGRRLAGLPPGRQFLSADGRHVSVSDRIADGSAWNEYRWRIYSLDGQRLGDLETFTSYSPFFVYGSTLILESRPFARRIAGEMREEPWKLRAVALSNGIEQWQLEFRDTTYPGPYPP